MSNKQYNNAGNLGDICKHAALLAFSDILMQDSPENMPMTYVDTHTFLLQAPFKSSVRWSQEIDSLKKILPSYEAYFNAEEKYIRSDLYRCSSGLMLDRWKQHGIHLLLGEKNDETRECLRAQLFSESVSNADIFENAVCLVNKAKRVNGPFLALVDPFTLDPTVRNRVIPALSGFCEVDARAIVEVFAFQDSGDDVDWPSIPAWKVRDPVAVLHRMPYHLAVYSTAPMQSDVLTCCEGLGWRIIE